MATEVSNEHHDGGTATHLLSLTLGLFDSNVLAPNAVERGQMAVTPCCLLREHARHADAYRRRYSAGVVLSFHHYHSWSTSSTTSALILIDDVIVPYTAAYRKLRVYAAQWREVSALEPTPPRHVQGHTPFVFGGPPPSHPTLLHSCASARSFPISTSAAYSVLSLTYAQRARRAPSSPSIGAPSPRPWSTSQRTGTRTGGDKTLR
ncbi:hypothetical protein B0H13DRAFT_2358887 [Mycena leptocephala]|nr:hypothetical protein B0H13DRAFT_2358887 [Mycena leptocephala]